MFWDYIFIIRARHHDDDINNGTRQRKRASKYRPRAQYNATIGTGKSPTKTTYRLVGIRVFAFAHLGNVRAYIMRIHRQQPSGDKMATRKQHTGLRKYNYPVAQTQVSISK
jgi:hypothetical protein